MIPSGGRVPKVNGTDNGFRRESHQVDEENRWG